MHQTQTIGLADWLTIMAEVGPGNDGMDGRSILVPAQRIPLNYYRDTPDGRRDWATKATGERDTLLWMATHGIRVDGTVYEVTDLDPSLLRDLGHL